MSENESQTKEEEIVVKEAPEAAPEPEQEASDEISPDVGIEALRHQLEMERQARSEAERRAKMVDWAKWNPNRGSNARRARKK